MVIYATRSLLLRFRTLSTDSRSYELKMTGKITVDVDCCALNVSGLLIRERYVEGRGSLLLGPNSSTSTYLLTYLPTCLPAYLPTYQPTYYSRAQPTAAACCFLFLFSETGARCVHIPAPCYHNIYSLCGMVGATTTTTTTWVHTYIVC